MKLLTPRDEAGPLVSFARVGRAMRSVYSFVSQNVVLLVTLAVSLRFLWVLTRTIARRVNSPLDLEWMEFGTLGHVLRILEGNSIYGPPEFEFVPYIYTPLYYYFGAALAPLFGVGLPQLRWVSIVATGLSCLLIFRVIRRAGGTRLGAYFSATLFVATYLSSGAWMDVARVDSLFVFFELLTLQGATSASKSGPIRAGVAALLATLTKQYGLLLVLPLAGFYLLRRRFRDFTTCAATFLVTGLACFGYLHLKSAGWVWFWIWTLPSKHELGRASFEHLAREQGLLAVPFLALLGLAGVALLARRAREAFQRRAFSEELGLELLVGAFCASYAVQAYLSFRHTGAFLNCLMPYHLGMALLAGLALKSCRFGDEKIPWLLACALHFVQLDFLPKNQVPSRAERGIGLQLAAASRTEPPTAVASHHASALIPPKLRIAHPMAVIDLDRARYPKLMAKLRRQAAERFANQPYRAVIVDDDFYPFMAELRRYYRLDTEASAAKAARMLVGAPLSPHKVYVPKLLTKEKD